MSRAQQIRQWLAENPGWHFPADVAEVVPATTQRVAACLTANYAGGAGNVQIFPAIIPTSASQIGTVTASPAASAAITIFGTASSGRVQNLVFHRDAFASAFVPLPVLASCEGYTSKIGNVSCRVMSFGNGLTDQENTRIDVLFALPAAVRPDHACRVTQ